jgi:hypothetical protein
MAGPGEVVKKIGKVDGMDNAIGSIWDQTNHPGMGGSHLPNAEHFNSLMARVDTPQNLAEVSDKRRMDAQQQQEVDLVGMNDESRRPLSILEQASRLSSRISPEAISPNRSFTEQVTHLKHGLDKSLAQLTNLKESVGSHPNVVLRQSTNQLLGQKTELLFENIQAVQAKLGKDFVIPNGPQRIVQPLKEFFNYLVNAEVGLRSTQVDVNNLDPKTFSPVDMLAMQLKVVSIQQQLEFFTSILNKGLESSKALMNVQV